MASVDIPKWGGHPHPRENPNIKVKEIGVVQKACVREPGYRDNAVEPLRRETPLRWYQGHPLRVYLAAGFVSIVALAALAGVIYAFIAATKVALIVIGLLIACGSLIVAPVVLLEYDFKRRKGEWER